MNKILAVGTLAFDEIETPFGATGTILGGSLPYITLAMVPFTRNIGLVSVVGGDFPEQYTSLLKDKGIDLTGVKTKKKEKTFFWKGRYFEDLNRRETLKTELNVLSNFNPIVPQSYKAPNVLILGNLDPKIQNKVFSQMDKNPEFVILDTIQFWIDNSWNDLMEVMKKVDAVCINDQEAYQVSKENTLLKAAKKIQAMGPKIVLIKRGEYGALVFCQDQLFIAPALPLSKVLDPTGAGDTFMGGFVAYLSAKDDYTFDTMKMAVVCGCAVASLCVESFGTDGLHKIDNTVISERMERILAISQMDTAKMFKLKK